MIKYVKEWIFTLMSLTLFGVVFFLGMPNPVAAYEGQTYGGIQHEAINNTFIERSDYSWPPRCGPRNCVAMCVTCGYDICRSAGGSKAQCDSQKEFCKTSCTEAHLQNCPHSDPFCDFN